MLVCFQEQCRAIYYLELPSKQITKYNDGNIIMFADLKPFQHCPVLWEQRVRNIAAGRQKCTRCPNDTGFQQIRPENICRQKMGEYDWRLHGDVEGCKDYEVGDEDDDEG